MQCFTSYLAGNHTWRCFASALSLYFATWGGDYRRIVERGFAETEVEGEARRGAVKAGKVTISQMHDWKTAGGIVGETVVAKTLQIAASISPVVRGGRLRHSIRTRIDETVKVLAAKAPHKRTCQSLMMVYFWSLCKALTMSWKSIMIIFKLEEWVKCVVKNHPKIILMTLKPP